MRTRRFLVTVLAAGLAAVGAARADDFSNNFRDHLNQAALDVLAKDLGAIAAAGSFHSGENLGFPLGFDVGAHAVIMRVQPENPVLRDDDADIASAFGQAEVGLPGRLNVIARGGVLGDAEVFGGGVRYGILTPSAPGLPAVSVAVLYNQIEHDLFDGQVLSGNAVVSVDLPFVRPYIGGGYDTSKLEPAGDAFTGPGAGADRSLEGEADGYRAEAGVNLSLIPFTYINLGAGLANGERYYHGGVGARF